MKHQRDICAPSATYHSYSTAKGFEAYIMDGYVMIYRGSTNPNLYDILYYIS